MSIKKRLKAYRLVKGEKIDYETSHAILVLAGKYVLQLRSNSAKIAAPGQWSLFGGLIEEGETPDEAIKREIYEELRIRPKEFIALWPIDYYDPYADSIVRTWFFSADVSTVWKQHELNEGKDVSAFTYEGLMNIKIPLVMIKAIKRFHEKTG